MSDIKEMEILRLSLSGENFKNLLKEKKKTKYEISKVTGISWRTLRYWELNKSVPSDENILKVAVYLKLIKPGAPNKIQLMKEIKAKEAEIEDLKKRVGQVR